MSTRQRGATNTEKNKDKINSEKKETATQINYLILDIVSEKKGTTKKDDRKYDQPSILKTPKRQEGTEVEGEKIRNSRRGYLSQNKYSNNLQQDVLDNRKPNNKKTENEKQKTNMEQSKKHVRHKEEHKYRQVSPKHGEQSKPFQGSGNNTCTPDPHFPQKKVATKRQEKPNTHESRMFDNKKHMISNKI